jgi:hypothetical protein
MDFGKLPLSARVGLAAVSGMLYWPALMLDDSLGIAAGNGGGYRGRVLFAWAVLFGVLVLAPYAWNRPVRVVRAIALCAASSLIYFAAFEFVIVSSVNSGVEVSSYLLAGGAGALLSALAVWLIGGNRLTGLGWAYVLVAGVAAGALFAMFKGCVGASLNTFGYVGRCYPYTASFHAVWQVLVCVALYLGVREQPVVGQKVGS